MRNTAGNANRKRPNEQGQEATEKMIQRPMPIHRRKKLVRLGGLLKITGRRVQGPVPAATWPDQHGAPKPRSTPTPSQPPSLPRRQAEPKAVGWIWAGTGGLGKPDPPRRARPRWGDGSQRTRSGPVKRTNTRSGPAKDGDPSGGDRRRRGGSQPLAAAGVPSTTGAGTKEGGGTGGRRRGKAPMPHAAAAAATHKGEGKVATPTRPCDDGADGPRGEKEQRQAPMGRSSRGAVAPTVRVP
ncbi:unnamed protein product [Urochloa humidicola]